MSTYREALFHARAGGVARRDGRIVRFLTREESEPILLKQRPSREVLTDDKGHHVYEDKDGVRGVQIGDDFHDFDGRKLGPIAESHKGVIRTFADTNYPLKRLGLFDVGNGDPIEYRPTEEDMAATNWELVVEPIADEIATDDASLTSDKT